MPDSLDVVTRSVTAADEAPIRRLHADVFGPGRFARTAYRVREGTPFASPYCRVVVRGDRIIAGLRMTPATVGGMAGSLLLGPLAVDPEFASLGFGRRVVAESFELATAAGFRLVLLVGNLSYYTRMGFVAVPPGQIWLPGPADPARILARELVPGALGAYRGLVVADF